MPATLVSPSSVAVVLSTYRALSAHYRVVDFMMSKVFSLGTLQVLTSITMSATLIRSSEVEVFKFFDGTLTVREHYF